MKTSHPNHSQHIEIDLEVLESLQGMTHLECPGCSNDLSFPVMAGSRHPAGIPNAAGLVAGIPCTSANGGILFAAQRGLNRNLFTLGAAASLVLGALGFFQAASGAGDAHEAEQMITDAIIHEEFFNGLIASGATTAKDLEAATNIHADGAGFIGVSKENITWQQARDLAKRTGARILDPGVTGSDSRKRITDRVTQSFPELLGTTVWVAENDQPRVIDSPDVNPVTSLDRPRRVFLQWASWKALVSTTFDESSPFGTTEARTWTSALEGGSFTLRRTDSGVLWLGAGGSNAGGFTSIRTCARISNSGIFAEKASRAVWGLLFRVGGSGYYAVEIRGDGCWQFYVRKDKTNHTISPWEFSKSVRLAGDFNDVAVEAMETRFKITVNGKELGSFENDVFANGSHTLLFASGGDAFYEFDHYELVEQNYDH